MCRAGNKGRVDGNEGVDLGVLFKTSLCIRTREPVSAIGKC